MLRAIGLNAAFALLVLMGSPVVAQEYSMGGYWAYIGGEDLYNSKGVRLKKAVQVLRQDRADVLRFGIVHPGDQADPWFAHPKARATMPQLLINGGGIDPYTERRIVAGHVPVYVSVFGVNGIITSMRVQVRG